MIAEKWKQSRDDLDRFALRSHQLAARAEAAGGEPYARLVSLAYRQAVAAGYRFYSYGDAMLLV